jgi:hypothetical protein
MGCSDSSFAVEFFRDLGLDELFRATFACASMLQLDPPLPEDSTLLLRVGSCVSSVLP